MLPRGHFFFFFTRKSKLTCPKSEATAVSPGSSFLSAMLLLVTPYPFAPRTTHHSTSHAMGLLSYPAPSSIQCPNTHFYKLPLVMLSNWKNPRMSAKESLKHHLIHFPHFKDGKTVFQRKKGTREHPGTSKAMQDWHTGRTKIRTSFFINFMLKLRKKLNFTTTYCTG